MHIFYIADVILILEKKNHVHIAYCMLRGWPIQQVYREFWTKNVWGWFIRKIYLDTAIYDAYTYTHIKGWAVKFIWWRICFWWILWPMGSKQCNTDGRSVWIASRGDYIEK